MNDPTSQCSSSTEAIVDMANSTAAITMYIYKMQTNSSVLLFLFILLIGFTAIGVSMLAAINEKLKEKQQKEQESEND